MKKKLTCLLILFASFLSVHSHNDTITGYKAGFLFEPSGRFYNFSPLNKVLKNAGFSGVENNAIGFSMGHTSRFTDKNSYGSYFVTLLETDVPNSENINKKAGIIIIELATEMHWVISKSSKWLIYPYSGIGISYSRLKLTETLTDLTFDQVLTDISLEEKNEKYLYNKEPLIFANIGIGIDHKMMISNMDHYLGLNLGYRLSTKSDWGHAGSPTTNYNCLELKLKMRFERNNKKPKHLRPNYYRYFN